jgi:tetratricopeptide (TPR) repeat protein
VVVVTVANGEYRYRSCEKIRVNGSDRVALAPSESALSRQAYKRLSREKIDTLGVVRRLGASSAPARTRAPRAIVIPDGSSFDGTATPRGLWDAASLTGSCQGEPVSFPGSAVAGLALGGSPAAAAVSFVTDSAGFSSPAERAAALSGLASSFPGSPEAAGAARRLLSEGIDAAMNAIQVGGPPATLQEAVLLADAAARAFPQDRVLLQKREEVRRRHQSLDAALASVKALAEQGRWDALLDQYPAVEPYEHGLPDLRALRERALRQSIQEHVARGRDLVSRRNYAGGLAELQAALRRDPENASLRSAVEEARLAQAPELRGRARASALSPARRTNLESHVSTAALYRGDRKWEEAVEELRQAEALDPQAPTVLAELVQLHEERGEFSKALAALERLDGVSTSPEAVKRNHDRRVRLQYALRKEVEAGKSKATALVGERKYAEALAACKSALTASTADPDLLYLAGTTAGIVRQDATAQALLERFMAVPLATNTNYERRAQARKALGLLHASGPAAGTPRSWLSGDPLERGAFYSPVSLAFQPRVAGIKGSGGLKVAFDWGENLRLHAVTESVTKTHGLFNAISAVTAGLSAANGDSSTAYYQGTDSETTAMTFEYYSDFPSAWRVARNRSEYHEADQQYSIAPTSYSVDPFSAPQISSQKLGKDERSEDKKWQFFTFLNNPRVNPAIAALVGAPVATVFSANPYFNPFVWSDIYIWQAEYDAEGRLATATTDAYRATFAWQGQKLSAIRVAAKQRNGAWAELYERRQEYDGERLVAENVLFGGQSQRIAYTYDNGRLARATFKDPGAHDGRRRDVTFLAN